MENSCSGPATDWTASMTQGDRGRMGGEGGETAGNDVDGGGEQRRERGGTKTRARRAGVTADAAQGGVWQNRDAPKIGGSSGEGGRTGKRCATRVSDQRRRTAAASPSTATALLSVSLVD